MLIRALFLSAALAILGVNVSAQVDLQEVSEFVSDTAETICAAFIDGGSQSSAAFDTQVEGELTALIRRIGRVEGVANIEAETERYVGVLQDQLADELSSNRECRLDVWNGLRPTVIALILNTPSTENENTSGPVNLNTSYVDAEYLGVAQGIVNERKFISDPSRSYYWTFDVLSDSRCSIRKTLLESGATAELLTSRRIQIERQANFFSRSISRFLGAGSYFLVIKTSDPTVLGFEVDCVPE